MPVSNMTLDKVIAPDLVLSVKGGGIYSLPPSLPGGMGADPRQNFV